MLQKLAFTSLAVAGFIAATAGSGFAQDNPAKKSSGGWAVVNSDGTLQGHENVTRVTVKSTGVYDVRFNQKISNCAATATIGGTSKTVLPGYIVLSKRSDTVVAHTFDALTALPADFKFNLNVACSSS
ncbi:MAG TPA: hypothetical protein VGK90_02260 [Rhizomicrobium sp.]|jgi:hypothetical protein